MSDLLIGILIVGCLASLVLVGTLRVSRTLPPRTANLLAIMTVALMLANSLLLTDSIALTRLLPFSNLIVVGNPQPLLVAMLAGIIWWRVPGPGLRRLAIIGALVAACLVAIYRPILSRPPRMQDRWLGNVCLQTSRASCSAAAAATLLARYNIKTSEQEMALLCLTSTHGTSMHGLWRGLRLKAAASGYDVIMFDRGSLDDLRGVGPVLLSVELKPDAKVDPRYQRSWGWLPGVPHSVVLLGFEGTDRALIADPASGLEVWSIDDLKILWHGVGARLVRAGA
ncbi:cysteine peptidase family C39 domain-containing protein [Fontivita pretiosa]|uniref:cysteine peptidase family C39 domain-containing protein n=1 Tax=Fontivita pretiosa TaxID=2989684 RepID=UPI003D176538